MKNNSLKLNKDNTELIVFSSKKHVKKIENRCIKAYRFVPNIRLMLDITQECKNKSKFYM